MVLGGAMCTGLAQAQPAAPEPSSEPLPPPQAASVPEVHAPDPDALPKPASQAMPTAPAASVSDKQDDLQELRRELQQLRREQEQLRVQLQALRRRQAETPLLRPPPEDGPPAKWPLTPTASVGLRYDSLFPADPYEQLRGEPHSDGFRMRVRAGLRHSDVDAAVIGGIRLVLGQPRNPAAGYVNIGDAFRTAPVGLDQFWAAFRPFDDRTFMQLTLGKMPLPIWRGDRGRWRSELVWDDDVSPVGVALDIKLLAQAGVSVENTIGYFVLHDIEDLRFAGLTGPASLIVDQLRVRWTYLTGAFAFYDYENLNTGLSSPGAATSGGSSTQAAANAFLMRDGLQTTNRRVSYGSAASGFVSDAFRIVNPAIQGHVPLPLDDIGKGSELTLMADYSHNLSVEDAQNGIGATAAIRTGDHADGWLSPVQLWFTYRYVEADATLATIADSNLGQGTDFRGFEIGASYDATETVVLSAGYFDYLTAPQMDAQVRRFFVDVRWDY